MATATAAVTPQEARLRALAARLPADWRSEREMSELIRSTAGIASYDNAAVSGMVTTLLMAELLEARRSGVGVREVRPNPEPPGPVSPQERIAQNEARQADEQREARERQWALDEEAQRNLRAPYVEGERRHIEEIVRPMLDARTAQADARMATTVHEVLRQLGIHPEQIGEAA